ncbi:hypothetical protein GCM10023216_29880 [Isoptericola chiayiensis]|uniref:Uncharacterized protein n=1 Tax=Isoptericola chiayiensis TaxID=579446 RepID=A0ABP8YR00_9MICO|nr:hypothetical protein [Isoptericola chiayiensis]NOW01856.1 hypothetical protein [Isoptericola chiayiensis]
MPAKAKTILIWLVVIFVIFAIYNSPDRASEVVTAIWDVIVNAVGAFGEFLAGLLD